MATIANTHAPSAGLFVILLVTATLCGPSPAALALEKAPAAGPPLAVSKALILTSKGGRNPTVAADQRSGGVYLAWAQEVPRPAALNAAWYTGTDRHPGISYARSEDEGKSFSKPLALLGKIGGWPALRSRPRCSCRCLFWVSTRSFGPITPRRPVSAAV